MACALIHSPPLLILDEPTVGIDPILSRDIWHHLKILCISGHTIILTTHYIEEARNANTVAFMRNGTILAEDNPNVLLNRYKSNKLEEVFLQLCHFKEDLNKRTEVSINVETQSSNFSKRVICTGINPIYDEKGLAQDKFEKIDLELVPRVNLISRNSVLRKQILSSELKELNSISIRNSLFFNKCFALLFKNFRSITRNPLLLFFEIILFSAMFIMMFICIGDGPSNIKLAINNEEHTLNLTDGWGQLFVKSIENRFIFKYYDSYEEALDSVKRGENHAVIHINRMFTKALILRSVYLKDTDKDILNKSKIRVSIDRSDQLIGFQIEGYLYKALHNFIKSVAKSFRFDPKLFKIPLNFEESEDDERKYSFRDFIIPGAYIAVAFFSTAMITGTVVIAEQSDGLLDRSLLAGIKASEFLLSNLLSQLIILIFQLTLLLILSYILFNFQIKGSLVLFILLILSQGLCGIAFGLFLAIITTDLIIGSLILAFTYIAVFLTSGAAWPIENMPLAFQQISKIMPNTIPVQSMRVIIYKGWGFDYFEVYMGFVITYIWLTIFLILGLIVLRRNK